MSDQGKLIIGGVGAVIVITLTLIFYSFDSLEPREFGILYNSIDKDINREDMYSGGLHWVGLFNSFIHFPGGYQTVEFSRTRGTSNAPLDARTSDGVSLGVSVSFQYQLIKKELPSLYDQSNTNYDSTFVNIARDVFLQTIAKYQARQFWADRQVISVDMENSLNVALAKAHASCVGLQLLQVTIPQSLENSIVDTQVEKQLSNTKVYEREVELIKQNTDIMNSECDQNITMITASATAEASFVVNVAVATAQKNILQIQSEIYGLTRNTLEFTDDDFTSYLFLRAVQQQTNATITVGLQDAVIQIKTG